MQLYHHKTDGGAEYLTDKFVVCPNGEKEGIFEGASYIVRIDGDITKDAELTVTSNNELLAALEKCITDIVIGDVACMNRRFRAINKVARAAISKVKGE